jgi:hypothetical protein
MTTATPKVQLCLAERTAEQFTSAYRTSRRYRRRGPEHALSLRRGLDTARDGGGAFDSGR